jgi:hypothetical protein
VADAEAAHGDLTDRLAAGVRERGITLAYGDKQTIGGVDIIPVAFVSYGFGGTQGSPRLGDGGGGGGVAIPLGAYVGGADAIHFRPNTIAVLALAIPVISTLGWTISRVIKAAK